MAAGAEGSSLSPSAVWRYQSTGPVASSRLTAGSPLSSEYRPSSKRSPIGSASSSRSAGATSGIRSDERAGADIGSWLGCGRAARG